MLKEIEISELKKRCISFSVTPSWFDSAYNFLVVVLSDIFIKSWDFKSVIINT